MFRIDDPSAVAVLPTPDAAGTPGYFTGGNPGGGQEATVVTADFLNMMQEEFISVLTAASVSPSKTTYTQLRDSILALIAASSSTVPSGVISGLVITNNSGDTANDIDISVGQCSSVAANRLVSLASIMTKRLDAAWAVGTTNGGLVSGSKTINTVYHVFLIRQTAGGSIDAMFDTNIAGSSVPLGWTVERRIGSIKTDGSNNIYQTTTVECAGGALHHVFKNPVIDATYTAAGNNTLSLTIVPTGIIAEARFNAYLAAEVGTPSYGFEIYEVARGALTPNITTAPLTQLANRVDAQSYDPAAGQMFARTNASAQVGVNIGTDSGYPSITARVCCTGYIDYRRV